MAKYFKPHKRPIKDPPNTDISVSSSCRLDRDYVFCLNINVERPDEEADETHVVELSRDEVAILIGQLQNALKLKF